MGSWLEGIYGFAAAFGVGVTLVDLLGLWGHSHGGAHQDGTSHGHESPPHDATHEGFHSTGAFLSVLRYLRMVVYFSLGFGPVGLIALEMGRRSLESALWAIPSGIGAAFLARAFFRFQQRDVDSSLRDDDLLFERGTVLVSINGENMGKVRLRVGPIVTERYARTADPHDSFRPGDTVQIVEVTEECVYVRRLDELS